MIQKLIETHKTSIDIPKHENTCNFSKFSKIHIFKDSKLKNSALYVDLYRII